jgi:hypothetical protein
MPTVHPYFLFVSTFTPHEEFIIIHLFSPTPE